MRGLQAPVRHAATKGRYIVVAEIICHDHHNIGGTVCRHTGRRGRAFLPRNTPGWTDLSRRQGTADFDGGQDRGAGVEIGSARRHCHHRHH